jgi:hypothetical protein
MGQYDIALRHVVQRHARDLVVGLTPAFPVESATWVETQLTFIERRLDKALELRGRGSRRLLQVEFIVDPEGDLGFRMFEYAALLVIALHAVARARGEGGSGKGEGGRAGGVGAEVPPVKSVALVLSGPRKPWPELGEYRTSWPDGDPFSGHRFQIEPVYQRTTAELLARPGAFWLVFTPLAVDANPQSMRQVVEEILRREPCEDGRADLYAALLVLAELDPWGHNLREEIEMLVQELDVESIMKSKTLREVFEKGVEKGIDKGRKECIEEMLHRMLVSRLDRELTLVEQVALTARTSAMGGAQDAAAVLELDADALVAWLLGPDAE